MNKRGISPLIATVLIIGFVIIGSILVITFINNLTKEQLEETEEQVKIASINVNYDVKYTTHYSGSKIQITNNNAIDLYFLIQQEDQVIITELIPAYNTRTFIGNYSDQITITPMIEQNGENKSLGSHVKEKWISEEPNNYALSFDGDDYIECPNTNDAYHVGDHTYMTWVKVDNPPPVGTISILGHYNWRISTATGTYTPRFAIVYQYPPSAADIVSSPVPLEVGKWQHYAAVYDYDNIDGRILLYLDGDLMGNVSIGNHSIETVYNVGAQELVMGHSHHGNAENLTGMQDEVRIYNRTLSQEEIQENMNNKLSGRESNLIGYWSFDKGSGNILYDLTENYNCDFYGDPQWVKI
jgi:hypothetical protein